MEYWWTNLIFLFLGSAIGFFASWSIESKKHSWAKEDREEKNKNILKGLEKEIEEGIERCEGLVGFLKNKKISFSRVYIAFWESAKSELLKDFKDKEILDLLHRIYYRFDLINFNMNRGRFDRGAAFAKEYIDEIKSNSKIFRDKINY